MGETLRPRGLRSERLALLGEELAHLPSEKIEEIKELALSQLSRRNRTQFTLEDSAGGGEVAADPPKR